MTELEEATKEGRVDARDGTGTKTKTEAKYYVKKMTSDEASIKKGHSKSDILLGPLKKLTSSTSTDDLKSKEKKAKKDERPEEVCVCTCVCKSVGVSVLAAYNLKMGRLL